MHGILKAKLLEELDARNQAKRNILCDIAIIHGLGHRAVSKVRQRVLQLGDCITLRALVSVPVSNNIRQVGDIGIP